MNKLLFTLMLVILFSACKKDSNTLPPTASFTFSHNQANEFSLVIFAKGLIYPTLIGGNQISSIEELKLLVQSPRRKRYRFLLYRKGIINPLTCFFELTNDDAIEKTGLAEFINGSRLTFFKQAWIMI